MAAGEMTSVAHLMEHYFSRREGRPERLKTITFQFEDHRYELVTSRRVFSPNKVDKGTLLLINEMEVPVGGLVLDLGCGYGALALCLSLKGASVVAVDVNAWAVWLAAENLKRYATTPWLVATGDLYSPFNARFGAILCNPPIRAGRNVVSRIIHCAPKYLRNDGSLQLVARTKMGAKTLSSLMLGAFGNVEEVAKKSGYRVLVSRCRGGRVD